MASVTFVHPLFLAHDETEQAAGSVYFPLGLLYLASYVRDHGHDVTIFDGTFEHSYDAFEQHLAEHQPQIVGISSVLTAKRAALDLAALAAQAGATVIFGGPDPTADPATYLANEHVDIVVHHEGEQTITRLLDLVDADQLSICLLYTSPSPRDGLLSRMPSSA